MEYFSMYDCAFVGMNNKRNNMHGMHIKMDIKNLWIIIIIIITGLAGY
jgi:hypothetical protein